MMEKTAPGADSAAETPEKRETVVAKFFQNEWKNLMTLAYLARLDRRVPEDHAMMRRRQGRKIHRVMKKAYTIPFYRERFEACGCTPDDFRSAEDLAKFPVMTRADLRSWMQEELKDYDEEEGRLEIFRTSGSSGIPLRFALSHREAACMNANWIRVTMFAGYRPLREKMLSFLTTHSHVDPEKGDSFIQKLGFFRRKVVPEHLYVGEGMRDLIQLINDYRPDMIAFRKNVLVRLAVYAKNHNLTIWRPKAYTPVSEMVDGITRRLLLDTFGEGLFDAYGCNETGSCAVRLPGKDNYYIYSDTHVLNLVDDEDHLADEGRVIATTLYKFDFPIINYEVGDRATSETIGGIRYLKRIMGRTNDMVRHADGTETSATELMKIPNGITGVAQFRYVQNSLDEISILLVEDPGDRAHTREDIEAFFARKIEELYGYPEYRLNFCWMEEIPPDQNGKMRCFICEVE